MAAAVMLRTVLRRPLIRSLGSKAVGQLPGRAGETTRVGGEQRSAGDGVPGCSDLRWGCVLLDVTAAVLGGGEHLWAGGSADCVPARLVAAGVAVATARAAIQPHRRSPGPVAAGPGASNLPEIAKNLAVTHSKVLDRVRGIVVLQTLHHNGRPVRSSRAKVP